MLASRLVLSPVLIGGLILLFYLDACAGAGAPILWGLAVAGEEGAANVLEILRRELDEAMLLCGCTTLSDVDRALLDPYRELESRK